MDQDPQERTKGLHRLVISAMFSVFLSIVVFVIASYGFFVPRMLTQQMQIAQLQRRVAALEAGPVEPEADAEEPAAPVERHEVWVAPPAASDAGPAATPASAPEPEPPPAPTK